VFQPGRLHRGCRGLHLSKECKRIADCAGALPFLKEVSNRMQFGPEKSTALINIAICYQVLQDFDESLRYFKIAQEAPNVLWGSSSPMEAWKPFYFYGKMRSFPLEHDIAVTRSIQALLRRKK